MSKSLESVAKNKNIPYQLEPIAGRTGTNADHISISGKGVKLLLYQSHSDICIHRMKLFL